ncbi:ATP-grasp domain-containing protein [Bacillus sp. FJAT-29790]|uniref:ATP-grasp domain-containing protein n=1 Tax=Bacillus sp. FJAT-29790 TaxID=1895002 RepID=UPI001C2171F6|nr:ATP-grasp domain-containing protein [Bacillus sp. FJAT-29790]MBU8879955.1 ATP-grasp domain-containing protein [Bacillus sp. FJAT-29790]
MKTIVFIGCSNFGTSKEALTIAKEMGYFVVLFTNKKIHKFPDVDHFVFIKDLQDEEKVIDEITKLKETGKQICACISFIDPYVSYAAKLSDHLGLVKLSADSLFIMENKIRVREKLTNLSSSPFYKIFNHDLPVDQFVQKYNAFLPLILKPPASNGSKNVLLVETPEKFKAGLKFLQKRSPRQPVLVEEYLCGPQFLIEIIVHKNKLTVVGVIEQEVTKNERFIVIGYSYPAMLKDEEYKNLLDSIADIIDQMGFSNGSCHLEMRMVQGKWKLVEINPRMSGGAMNRMIEEGTGMNLIKEILRLSLGEKPSLIESRKQHVYARYLTISTRGKLLKVTGREQALKHKDVKYVHIKPQEGSILIDPHTMGNRYACIIAAAESPEQARTSAIAAAKEIKFYLEPL